MAELRKILHVDDDEDIRALTRISLETVGGFDLAQCASGQEGIDTAPAFAPDLFLVDSMMPGMTGEEMFRILKTAPELAEIPVVFMTARAQSSATAALLDLGATDVITKPFDPIELPQRLREIWARVHG